MTPAKTSTRLSVKGFELTLARRLAWKPEGRRRVSPAVGVAVAGVALSIMVMLLSAAVMYGFKQEVTRRIMSIDDCITITGYATDNRPSAFNPAEVISAINVPADAEIVRHTSLPSILKTPDDFMGVEFRSLAANPPADTAVILSDNIAAKLSLKSGDRIPSYFFVDDRIRVRVLTVDSLYHTGFGEHDASVVFCSPSLIEGLAAIPAGHVQSLGLRNIPADRIESLASEIYSSLLTAHYSGRLSSAYGITTILQSDASFFSWLELLDTNVAVIMILMGLVAAFTLVSSLFIIILERVRTIGLLKAMGATNGQIRKVFMLMAERLVVRGLAIGNAAGLALIAVQALTHAVPLDPSSYYVDFVPVKITAVAIVTLNAGALLLSWLVLMIPAMIIARISPASTMRYE